MSPSHQTLIPCPRQIIIQFFTPTPASSPNQLKELLDHWPIYQLMAVVNFFRIIYADDNVRCPIAIMTQILLDCMTGYLVNIFQLANNNYRLKSIYSPITNFTSWTEIQPISVYWVSKKPVVSWYIYRRRLKIQFADINLNLTEGPGSHLSKQLISQM